MCVPRLSLGLRVRKLIVNSSIQAYFEPNAGRKNLVVTTGSSVSRIIFRPESSPLLATGVEFIHGDSTFTAMARKEVILCAGSQYFAPVTSVDTEILRRLRSVSESSAPRTFWYVECNSPVVSADTFIGIGKRDILNKYGIKILLDLPGVGENLRK